MNYQKTKIYKIWSTSGDKIYIGSTTKDLLSQRMAIHRSHYKTWIKNGMGKGYISSFALFQMYGIENCYIELLESYACHNIEERRKKEGEYIRSNNCINKNYQNDYFKS